MGAPLVTWECGVARWSLARRGRKQIDALNLAGVVSKQAGTFPAHTRLCKCGGGGGTSQGSVAFVHRTCLENWLSESGTSTCELCHQPFNTERTPRFSSSRSVWYWLRHGPRYPGTGVRGDIIACSVITPLAVVVTYVCLYSSEYYGQQKFSQIPAAKWTSISLLIMIAIMLFGYYLWVHSVVRLHARMWYSWWQRSCVVRYIPPSTISLQPRALQQSAPTPHNTPNLLGALSQSATNVEAPQNDTVIDIEAPCASFDELDLK
ncbi:hypothetical protein HUJ05_011272 [Dendroctonus ponderosae]|nr:hypothetical protein HUJ05_011272 [Dendroctonus ponderosae]